CPRRLVVAKSTRLRFRLVAKTALVPLLLLFPANPLRWASPGGTREITQNATGDGSDEHCRAHSRPPYPLLPFRPSPPDPGSRPRPPFYGGRQLGGLGCHRKGAGGSADWLTFYDRCR